MPAVFLIALVVVQSLLLLVHWELYLTIQFIFSLSGTQLDMPLALILSILSISFLSASVLAFRYNNRVTRVFYTVAALWMGTLLYMLLAVSAYWVILLIIPGLSSVGELALGKLMLMLALGTSLYGIYHARQTQMVCVSVRVDALPLAWKGRKAVFVSDLHLGQVNSRAFAARVVSRIQREQPDLVFIGGDVYDGVAVDAETVIEPFRSLHVPQGVYFVTGNHEEFTQRDRARYLESIRAVGITILDNERVTIDGVNIVGVDYADSSDARKFASMLATLVPSKSPPTILLKHTPLHLDIAEKAGVSLQLSGHTHRAQIVPLNLFTSLIFRGYDYGLKRYGTMSVYTSSGVGTWGPPLRVGTRSEIILVTFVSA